MTSTVLPLAAMPGATGMTMKKPGAGGTVKFQVDEPLTAHAATSVSRRPSQAMYTSLPATVIDGAEKVVTDPSTVSGCQSTEPLAVGFQNCAAYSELRCCGHTAEPSGCLPIFADQSGEGTGVKSEEPARPDPPLLVAMRVHPWRTAGTPKAQLSRRCRSFRATSMRVAGTTGVTERLHRLSF